MLDVTEKMKIEEVQSTSKKLRVAIHAHIKGFDLEPIGRGRAEVREAAGPVVDMIRQKKRMRQHCTFMLAERKKRKLD